MPRSEHLTQKDAAARLEISPATLRRLSADGVVPRRKDKKYPWPEVRDAYVSAGLGNPPLEHLTQKEAAERLGITSRQLRTLTTQGQVPRADDGRYPFPATQAAYDALKVEEEERRRGSPNLQAEKARLTREQADAKEMENRVRRGELIDVRDVVALSRRPAELMARALKTVPARQAKSAAGRLGVSEAVALELLEEFAEQLRTMLREAIEDAEDVAA